MCHSLENLEVASENYRQVSKGNSPANWPVIKTQLFLPSLVQDYPVCRSTNAFPPQLYSIIAYVHPVGKLSGKVY